MDIQKYLTRIRIKQAGHPGYPFLVQLQKNHLLNVPFENLDVIHGRPINLDHRSLYDKIVHRRRGGFCYELNGIFGWLLAAMGYVVSMASAQVYSRKRGQFGPAYDHMILLVRLEKTYLVDVGFGDGFRIPIPLPIGFVEDVSGQYRVHALDEMERDYLLQKYDGAAWQPEYRFTTTPQTLSAFGPMCQYHQTSPKSSFTQSILCTIATPKGRTTLSQDALTITSDGTKRKIPISSSDELAQLLSKHFGIQGV